MDNAKRELPAEFLNAATLGREEGVLVFDADGGVFLSNPAAEKLLGYGGDELAGMPVGKLLRLGKLAPVGPACLEQPANGIKGMVLRKDGLAEPVFYAIEPVVLRGTFTGAVITLEPVGYVKKRPEQPPIEDEKLFLAMAEAATVVIWMLNVRMEVVYVNKAGLEYSGTALEELASGGFVNYMHPDDWGATTEALLGAFEAQGDFRYESRVKRADGAYRWTLTSGGPIFNSNGEFMGLIGSAVDIHDLKEAQDALATYAQKLERSNKELEHFATIASHDLQEPLRKVILFSEHLRSKEQDVLSPEGLDDIERMQRATLRMQRLIGDLLDLSKVTRRGGIFSPTDFSTVLREVLADLAYKIKDTHARVEVEGDLPCMDADPRQIHQMFFQLLDNALIFRRKEVPPVIKIRGQAGASGCEIVVEDNGQGFKAEYAHKIFDIFVRLHRSLDYPGTGIGLALVHRIIERHGGSITAQGEPNRGAVFIITLPCSQSFQQVG